MPHDDARVHASSAHPSGAFRRRAAGWAARIGLVALTAWIGTGLALPFGPAVDVAVGVLLGLALLGLGSLLLGMLRWVANGWVRVLGAPLLAASLGALALLLGFAGLPPLVALAVWGVWGGAAALLALAYVANRDAWSAGTARRRIASSLAAGAAAIAAVSLVTWWWLPGGPTPTPPLDAADVPLLALPDPGEPGPHRVATFSYGSGLPAWRQEYASGATVRTSTVDLADLVTLGPVAGPARRAALGHGLDAVPRNALVWYPADAAGPAPLVLVAHGNANLFVPSEEGYGWLGTLLASHGFVVVSIDASAFNALPIVGGLRGENAARALLMLAHLDLWRGWVEADESSVPRVDLDRVALVGHSRGGEAAAIAATLARLDRLPNDARDALSERVGGPHPVRAVVAFAPSDGQYRVGDRPTVLDGVDYLVVQGGLDADVSSFVGERQYERAQASRAAVKAAVYVHHANHGQFNDRWGRRDQLPPTSALLRTGAIMPSAAQQRAGAVLVHAFLRASLLGEREFLTLFRDPRAGAHWLPATSYVTRFDDGSGLELLAHAGVDPTIGALQGSGVHGEGLALWRVGDPGFRAGVVRDVSATTLGWVRDDDAPAPSHRLTLPRPLAALLADVAGSDADAGAATLTLEVARGYVALPAGTPAPTGPLDLSLVLTDAAGRSASVPLSSAQGVPPHLPSLVARFAPLAADRYRPAAYPLYQRIDVPLAELLATAPELDLASVTEVALVFDRSPSGVIVVRSMRLHP